MPPALARSLTTAILTGSTTRHGGFHETEAAPRIRKSRPERGLGAPAGLSAGVLAEDPRLGPRRGGQARQPHAPAQDRRRRVLHRALRARPLGGGLRRAGRSGGGQRQAGQGRRAVLRADLRLPPARRAPRPFHLAQRLHPPRNSLLRNLRECSRQEVSIWSRCATGASSISGPSASTTLPRTPHSATPRAPSPASTT